MTEGIQNLIQQIQEQILTSAQDFYEISLLTLYRSWGDVWAP